METAQIQDLARKTLLSLVGDDYFIEYLQGALDETLKEAGVEPDSLDDEGMEDYVGILSEVQNLIHKAAAQTK
jgi:hypothetical protein